jgi:hypothetical protein
VPGTDHASIAVQTILEKQLKAEGPARTTLAVMLFLSAPGPGRPKAVVEALLRLPDQSTIFL